MNLGDIAQMLQSGQATPQGVPPQGLADIAQQDTCGPQPPTPNYYSPQAVRDAYMAWKMCKSGG